MFFPKLKTLYIKMLLEYEMPKNPKKPIKPQFGHLKNYFVIDNNAKPVAIGEDEAHGDAVFQYPELHKEALEMFGTDEKIHSAATDGSSKLYSILYSNGFARCAAKANDFAWIAMAVGYNKEIAMTFLRICRERNITKLSVETINEDYYTTKDYDNYITIEEFIDKYA